MPSFLSRCAPGGGVAATVLSIAVPVLGAQQPAAPPVRSTWLASSRVGVPMPTPGDRPIVDAWVNGRGPFHLGVETGSPAALILFTAAADSAAVRADGPIPRSGTADSVRIGGLMLEGVQAFIPGPSILPNRLDGMLGLGAFAGLSVEVDFPHKRLSFSRDTLPFPDGAEVLALTAATPLFAVPVQIAHRSLLLALDTQGGVPMSLDSRSVATLHLASPPEQTGVVRGPAIGTVPRRSARLLDDVRIGRYTIERPIIEVGAPPRGLAVDGIFGIHALRDFAVTLDQRTQRVRLHRSRLRVAAPPALREHGIAVGYDGGVLAVLQVFSKGPAVKAGILPGARILAVNGRSTVGFAPSDWEPFAHSPRPLRLLVEQDSARSEVWLDSYVAVR